MRLDRPPHSVPSGQANHYNPVAIVVPCHRVLASGRRLGGYGGGLAVKALLLRLEGADFREGSTVLTARILCAVILS